jgi:hypothetical protein
MKFFTAILSALALAVSTTTATPIDARAELLIIDPVITEPKNGDMWYPGTIQNVTWETSGIPPQASHKKGTILLGYWTEGSQEEHLEKGELLSLSLSPAARRLDQPSFALADWKTLISYATSPFRQTARVRLSTDGRLPIDPGTVCAIQNHLLRRS